MDLLRTILLYLSMLYIAAVQAAPDPSTVHVTPTPVPTPFGIVITATPVPTPSPTPVPTPSITANPAYGQMNFGDRDDTVAEMQRKLADLGYYIGEIDGAYGNQTRHAVELFQYQNGLKVDGIAGRYTLTILYESGDVKPAPPEMIATSTPAFFPDETVTPPPATQTPVPTETPAPTETPDVTQAPTATPTVAADLPVPLVIDAYHFVMAGFTQPLTVLDTDTVLHPVEYDETLYVPLPEILKSAGNIIITNEDDGMREIAFSVVTDLYQVSYTLLENGAVSDLSLSKNAQPQPLLTRNALLIDGIFYLPMLEMERVTGITFTMNETGTVITVTMPATG